MDNFEQLEQEIEAFRERLSRMSEASIRINESLDFDSVLQEVVDSACLLTNARYGAITVLDEAGQFQDVATSGLTPEQHRQLWELSEGPALREYFSYVARPVRFSDLSAYASSLGIPGLVWPTPLSSVSSILATPIRHQGEPVGAIYVGHEEHEFTQEDEDTLVMFASQAAQVIGNARRYRDEQRARSELETLINTAPVGVAVFDARTGAPVSFNREAVRILQPLQSPDHPPEHIIEFLTMRRADGRQVSLREFPLATLLSSAEMVRAEEIAFEMPDGRSVTTLVNVTPIPSEEGDVESVVVTLQDLTPLEELEQLRAEFLGMVSHELRRPLASIRGSASTLLDAADLDQAESREFHRIILEQADHMRGLISDLLDVARIDTGTLPVDPRPGSIIDLVDEARNAFFSGGGQNNITIDIPLELPQVMADRRRIVQVLGNLLNNASRHSPESTNIHVACVQDGMHVAVSVSDHGRGISADQLRRLFQKYSRTDRNEDGQHIESSGLGLAICKGIVEAHGGRIWAESEGQDRGARFTFTVPAVEAVAPVSTMPAVPARFRFGTERVRVLAVDDDPQMLRYVRQALSSEGYAPTVTGDPAEVLRLVAETRPHLVLLDMVLPGSDGIALMEEINSLVDVPVIFLSAYGQDQIIARAFDNGAADYVVKPFSSTELAARIRAALRKRSAEASETSELFEMGELTINYPERTVAIAGQPLQLTATEFGLLAELSANAGRVVTHEQLLVRVWGTDGTGDSRPMRTIVKNLRRKLGDDADNPRYVITERRVGYRMPKPEPDS